MSERWPVLLMSQDLDIGGCQRDLTRLATGIDRDRFEPHVACFRFYGVRVGELQRAGVPILHVPVYSFRSPQALSGARLLGRYLRQHRIRLVHGFDIPASVFAMPVARWYRTQAAVSSQLSYRDMYTPFFQRLLYWSDRLSHRVVVNCDAVRRDLTARWKTPADRLYLCYNGVDPQVFHPGESARPASLAGVSVVVGVACGLRPEKGLDLLIRAFARVRMSHPSLKLLIVGDGPLRDDLGRLAAELGVAADVVFQPGCPNVQDWLRMIDVFVLPSHTESFSNALLEAMASGCCVIGSRVGGTPELIAANERGLLFESGDVDDLAGQLERVVMNPLLRSRLAKAAVEFTHSELSVGRFLARMESLYTDLLRPAQKTAQSAV